MKDSKELAGKALAPLMRHVEKNRGDGVIADIVRRLTAMTGQQQYRQNVDEWLNADETARREPRLGIGIALLTIQSQMVGGQTTIGKKGLKAKRTR